MTAIDEQIGRNLATLRKDVSQRDLAAEMKARGWKWTHVTVGAVERGERPLRLAEAQAVLDILDANGIFGTAVLTSPDANTEFFVRVRGMTRIAKKLQDAGEEFMEAQFELASNAEAAELSPAERQQAESWLRLTAGDVAMEATRRENPPTQEEIDRGNAGYPLFQMLHETYGKHSEEA